MRLEDILTKDMKNTIMKVVWPIVSNFNRFLESEVGEEKIGQHDWFYLSEHLKEGDVLLSTRKNTPSNAVLPGKAKHAAMVVNASPTNPMMIEATSKGVHLTTLFDFLMSKKYVVHCRTKVFGEPVRRKAVAVAEGMIGRKYDHFWSPDNNWIYCSELVYESYKKAYLNIHDDIKPASFPLEMKVRCGELTYIPDDIRLDPVHWDVLWSNAK